MTQKIYPKLSFGRRESRASLNILAAQFEVNNPLIDKIGRDGADLRYQ